MRSLIATIYLCSVLISCTPPQNGTDILLASVYNRHLYMSELEGLLPQNASAEDSSLFMESYVRRWVRDALLLREAEQDISNELNINKLVRNYKESLILSQYEKKLTDNLLDSEINRELLDKYYNETKSNYHLENNIIRCHLIKVPAGSPDPDSIRQFWENGNIESMLAYAADNAEEFLLDTAKWYDLEVVAAYLPPGTLTNQTARSGYSQMISSDGYLYFFRVFESISTTEIPPVEYIEDQLKRLILHQRKQRLLDEIKEDLYNRELGRNNVKIYLQ